MGIRGPIITGVTQEARIVWVRQQYFMYGAQVALNTYNRMLMSLGGD